MKYLLLSMLVALNCDFAYAQAVTNETKSSVPTEVEIKDPTTTSYVKVLGTDAEVPIGEMVILTAELVNPPKEIKAVNYSWTVLPTREVVVWPDQSKIIFGTGSKSCTYTIVITAAVLTQGSDSPVISSYTAVTEVKVGGGYTPPTPTPNPNPNPNPGPDPTPPNPDNTLSDIGKQASEWVNLVKQYENYKIESIKKDAEALAMSFETIASAIAAGVYKDYSAILDATRASNRQALKNQEAWTPWFTLLSNELYESYEAGTIKTPEQIKAAWSDIAKGLRKAAK